MLVFGSFFFIQKKGIFGFDIGNLIIESEEVMFEILELEEFFLEGSDDSILVSGFDVVEMEVC